MRATSAAPVAIVFASNASPTLPPARRSPMMPEPTTAANSIAVPVASATRRRGKFARVFAPDIYVVSATGAPQQDAPDATPFIAAAVSSPATLLPHSQGAV